MQQKVIKAIKNKLFHLALFGALLLLVLLSINNKSVHATTYRDTILAEPTLLNYWPMDEASGATSLSPAAGGTVINLTGATVGLSGQVDGTAVSFNGTTNFGVTASNLDYTSYSKLVVEALIFVSSYDNSIRITWELSPSALSNQGAFYFAQDVGGTNSPTLKGDGGFNNAEYTRPSAGQWHLFTMVYDTSPGSNEVEAYIDGDLQTPTSRPFNVNNTNNFGNFALYLMSRGGGSFFSAGKMQHLAIYSDLSSSQIALHAQAAGLRELLPGTLSESSRTTTSATVSWTSASNVFNPPIIAQLQRSAHGANSWSNVSGATSSPAVDTGLSVDTSYDYRVAYTDATATTVYSNTLVVTTMKVYPPYTANSDTVIVGPYDTARSGAGNWSPGAAGSVQWLVDGHQYRVRQSGTINRLRIYTPNNTNLTGFYLQIWRKNGTTYDLVGQSNNIASSLANASFSTVDLLTPISGVQIGDFYGARMETSGSAASFYAYNPGSVVSKFIVNQTASLTGMDWAAQFSSATVVPIEMYMSPAPQVVFIGDSIFQGVPGNYSFLDPTDTTNLASSIEGQFSGITGYTYQNMGKGSDTTAIITSRFTNDVINLHPRIVVMEGGVNDIYGGAVTKAQFLANWTTNLAAAQASSSISKILVLKILPWTNGTNVQNQTRDDWNAALETLVANYSKATVVDASTYVGQFRSGGDVGNLWDIQTAFSADGVHFNQTGHGQIAQALVDSIDTTIPTITNISSNKVNGYYKTGEVIDIDITFSEAVSSTGDVTVTLETGATDRTCTFTVTSSTTGTCNYTVQAGDASDDLTVSLISGTIADEVENSMSVFSPVTNLAANKTLIIDTRAPTISAVTLISSPTSDVTPSYAFTTDETGTVGYGGACSSTTTTALAGVNIVTFISLADGTYTNCTITITDTATNVSNTLAVASFTIDTSTPASTSAPAPVTATSSTIDDIPEPEVEQVRYNTVTFANSSNGAAIQLETPEGTTITCSASVAESTLSNQDSEHSYPVGLVDFCLTVPIGSTNTIKLTFVTNLALDDVMAFKFSNEVGTYTEVRNATITETMLGNQRALLVAYQVTDGGELDGDSTVNGTILDPIGLAASNDPESSISTTTPPYLLITLSIIGVSGLLIFIAANIRARR